MRYNSIAETCGQHIITICVIINKNTCYLDKTYTFHIIHTPYDHTH